MLCPLQSLLPGGFNPNAGERGGKHKGCSRQSKTEEGPGRSLGVLPWQHPTSRKHLTASYTHTQTHTFTHRHVHTANTMSQLLIPWGSKKMQSNHLFFFFAAGLEDPRLPFIQLGILPQKAGKIFRDYLQ